MYINSPGGSFTALTAIYDTMQYIKPQVQTVCLGQAASAAAVLLAAVSPGKRLALPNARILIHQPAMEGMQGQASDIQIVADEIDRMASTLGILSGGRLVFQGPRAELMERSVPDVLVVTPTPQAVLSPQVLAGLVPAQALAAATAASTM